ncbi:hypothetical protein [Orenia marismortui]|uniref:hypothetical protein n=1 Tax=Orenia marismortui TaxID=46469 RepID=UPI00036A642A|nr:hypothetical protein [Orenia marismortui]
MKKILYQIVLLLVLSIILSSTLGFAAEREIYIGDLVKLKIDNITLTKSELREKFKDFDIQKIEETDNGYKIAIRSFEAGEKIVDLGDKNLKIKVKSTLNEVKRDDIYEAKLSPKKAQKVLPLQRLLISLIIVIFILLLIRFRRGFMNRGNQNLSIYGQFRTRVEDLKLDNENYFVLLTLAFKDYLELSFQRKIIGKTSAEIMEEIRPISMLEDYLNRIEEWLSFSDLCKYTSKEASEEEKKDQYDELIKIVDLIEANKEV